MKKQWLLSGCAIVLFGCSSGSNVMKEGTGTFTNSKGEVTTAEVKLKDDMISEVEIDETAKGKDKSKKELGDEYGMKEASSIKKEWDEQVDFFEKYVEKHGMDKIKLDKDGKAENNDVKSGCTISIEGFMKAIEDAKKNAK